MGQKLGLLEKNKKIIVHFESTEIFISIPDHPITSNWLISEAIRISKNPNIIGLRTSEGLELIDSLLTFPNKSIPPEIQIFSLEAIIKQPETDDLSLSSFTPIKIIGNGGFCKVYLVINKNNGKLYAMKAMEKEIIHYRNKTEQVLTELRIMEDINHPFIVSLHSAFQTVWSN